MDKVFTVAEVVIPILAAILLGIYARRRAVISPEGNRGLQQFVMKFGLPCVLFTSCLTAELDAGALSSMAMVLPLMLCSALWAFRWGRKRYPYHNLPMLFAAQETGMLGIPLFIILFGAGQAYRMGMLDLVQALVACPAIAILSADTGENPTPAAIAKKTMTSPVLVMSLAGLVLNLSGAAAWLDGIGVGGIIRETTSFLAQPVSAAILFSVGYNFSVSGENRAAIFRVSAFHFALQAVFCLLIQAGLLLVPGVEPGIRWAVLLYCTLPASFLAPSLGKTEDDAAVAAGVCSVLTVVCMVIFSVIAAVAV